MDADRSVPAGALLLVNEVPAEWPRNVLGGKGVAQSPDGSAYFIELKLDPFGPQHNASGASSSSPVSKSVDDARVFQPSLDGQGIRFRDFRATVDMMVLTLSTFLDWPIKGPRTVIWLLRHMIANGGTPMAFHHRWLSETRLDSSSGGVSEHMTWCHFSRFS